MPDYKYFKIDENLDSLYISSTHDFYRLTKEFTLSTALALLFGILLSLVWTNPFMAYTKKYTPLLLGTAITGLGAGLNIFSIIDAGLQGFFSTVIVIIATLALGITFGRFFKIKKNLVLLISAGTAICGGSAIAALSASLKTDDEDTSVALGIVFLLNAIALFLFPFLGHLFNLTEVQFGLWSAVAIHDTSSVIGASLQYGPTALQVATTVKLARALWIIPVTILLTRLHHQTTPIAHKKWTSYVKIPWFIVGFLTMALLATIINRYVPEFTYLMKNIEFVSKKIFILVLFLIGTHINIKAVKSVGPQAIKLAVILWLFIAVSSFYIVTAWPVSELQ